MEFFTKEWYETVQKSHINTFLEIDPRAEFFSDAYFRQVYAEAKAKWFEFRSPIYSYGNEPFNAQKETVLFRNKFLSGKRALKTKLPEEILRDVADIRVLALNRCTAEIKSRIDDFAQNCEKQTQDTIKAQADYRKALLEKESSGILHKFYFHDAIVASAIKHGEDYYISFEIDDDEYAAAKRIVFKKAEIIEMEKRLKGAWWLYEEIHITESGYLISVLFAKGERDNLFEFSVKCDDVVVEYNQKLPKIN